MKTPSLPAFAVGLGVLWIAAVLVGVSVGAVSVPPRDLLAALAGRGEEGVQAIVWTLRFPRVVLALLVGGALAVAGASLQALVRNPLADPYLLGLSGGASLGAVAATALGVGSAWGLPAAAFVGALAAVLVVLRLGLAAGAGGGGRPGGPGGPGRARAGTAVLDTRIVLLAGVVVGAFAGAVVAGVLAVSEPADARGVMVWLMGGLSGASWPVVGALAVYAAPALVVLAGEARALDLFSLGEEPAGYLGAEVAGLKRRVYLAASLLTAAAVAAAGIIGFVGLVVPHAIRLLRGHRHRVLLPAAFFAGGAFLALADALARVSFAPRELPVGVVTALVGVPLFAWLLRRWTRPSSS